MSNINTLADKCPILETEHFIIRAFQKIDLQRFTEYRSNKEVAKYQSWSDYTYQDALNLFESMDYAKFGQHDNWYQMAITQKESGELIGDLALHFIDQEKMEVGFTVSPEHQRQGVGFEALSALLDYLFLKLNKQKIVAFVDVQNQASYSLLEKAGFKKAANLSANDDQNAGWGEEYLYVKLRAMHDKSH